MITETAINLSIIGATCILVLVYLTRFVFRYKHQYESNPLCTSAVIFSLLITFVTTFILPVDIFLVSFVKESDGSFKEWATNETLATIDKVVLDVYYSLYGIIVLLVFVLIPFLHFLNEESESNSHDRFYNAVKYTFGIIVFIIMILIIGALIPVDAVDPNSIFNKILHVTEMSRAQAALTSILAIITSFGLINVSFYTASGIFSWPVGLLLGTSSVAARVAAMGDQETLLRMRINNLKEKSRVGRLTPAERNQLFSAEIELGELIREQEILAEYNSSLTHKLRKLYRPLQITFGVLFGLLSILLVATLTISNVDRILHGSGFRQGYILLKPTIFNPLEYVYTQIQDKIFFGPMPLLAVTSFLVVATISGTRNLGLWFMFARLHRIKIKRTHPQALLFFCITVVLTATAFNLILYSMTTEYVTFGNQKLRVQETSGNWITKPCSLENYQTDCIMTRGSVLIMQMMSRLWVFGAFFYCWSWVFVLVGFLSMFAYLIRGRRSPSHEMPVDQEEFVD